MKELVDAKNSAEAMIHSVQKTMKEHQDKLSDEEKKGIEDAIKGLEEAIKSDTVSYTHLTLPTKA